MITLLRPNNTSTFRYFNFNEFDLIPVLKGNTKSDDNSAHKPSKCVKNSGSVCYGSLCPSDCKKIKFISLILPVPGYCHVDADASLADEFRAASDISKLASQHLGKRNSAFD